MGKYKLSKKAKEDVNNIWEYTFNKWSLTQADKYFSGLQYQFNIIASNPNHGRSYEFYWTELLWSEIQVPYNLLQNSRSK